MEGKEVLIEITFSCIMINLLCLLEEINVLARLSGLRVLGCSLNRSMPLCPSFLAFKFELIYSL